MFRIVLPIGMAVLALTVGAWGCRNTANTHEGRVVEVGAGTLTITDLAGTNQHTYTVASNAVITCDGMPCELTDLKAGDPVTVTTTTKKGKTLAAEIEASKFLAVS